MKWLAIGLLACVGLIMSVITLPVLLPLALIGPAGTTPLPGVVPPTAAQPPVGPPVNDSPASPNATLLTAIQPWLGSRYVFGGNIIGATDCSGFSLAIARAVYGVNLPRTAQGQYDATTRIDSSNLQPGDLVFFLRTYQSPDWITHVGVYIGDGWMVSAIEPVLGRQSLSSPYWLSHYAGAGRVRR